jgi:hypothetical protein
MVESIYVLKAAWCGAHHVGLWPEHDFQSVTVATAFQAMVFTQYMRMISRRTPSLRVSNLRTQAADINQTIN